MSVAHKARPHTTRARRAHPAANNAPVPAGTAAAEVCTEPGTRAQPSTHPQPAAAAGTAPAPLGNAENSRPPQVMDGFTPHLWRIQRAMWTITADKALAGCHRWPVSNTERASVERTGSGGRGRLGGLQNSHSVWGSPVAAVGIARGRQEELQRATAAWLAGGEGRALAMVTLTVRHRRGEALADLLAGVSKAWSKVNSCRAWKAPRGIRRRYGIGHYVWFLEITHGDNGWHPHRHMVLLLERELSPDELAALKAELYALWADKVADLGLLAPNEAHGVDVQQVATNVDAAAAIATYAAKGMFAGLAAEATGGAVKQARNGNRTPFQILEDIADALDAGEEPQARDVALWREYEAATKGRQQRRWSTGALDALAVAVVPDDELEELEATEPPAEPEEEPVALVALDAEARRRVAEDVRLRLLVTEAANYGATAQDGAWAVARVLAAEGVHGWHLLMVEHERVDMALPSAGCSPVLAAEARAVLV